MAEHSWGLVVYCQSVTKTFTWPVSVQLQVKWMKIVRMKMQKWSRTSRVPPRTVLLKESHFAMMDWHTHIHNGSALRVLTDTCTHRRDRFYYLDRWRGEYQGNAHNFRVSHWDILDFYMEVSIGSICEQKKKILVTHNFFQQDYRWDILILSVPFS